jgi:hypothetical protein
VPVVVQLEIDAAAAALRRLSASMTRKRQSMYCGEPFAAPSDRQYSSFSARLCSALAQPAKDLGELAGAL